MESAPSTSWDKSHISGSRTLRDRPDSLSPYNWKIGISACTVVTTLGLCHLSVLSTQEVLLSDPQLRTGLDHVDNIYSISHFFEIRDGLCTHDQQDRPNK